MAEIEKILFELRKYKNPEAVKGMSRFGINPHKALGISIPILRKMAKKIGKDHSLALALWESDIHEAKILASMVDDPKQVTPKQMDCWIEDFNSWDVCDQVLSNLFRHTPYSYRKAIQWPTKEKEFEKRAGFVMMAVLASGDKNLDEKSFIEFLNLIKKHSKDNRNYVKKAVNWALRQIGKRNITLNKFAVETARQISKIDSSTARWIGVNALRELESENVLRRLRRDG